MHFFKYILVTFMITLSTLLFVGCEGGEADYSLGEVEAVVGVEVETIAAVVDISTVSELTTALDNVSNDYALEEADGVIVLDQDLKDNITYMIQDNSGVFELIDGVLKFKDPSSLVDKSYEITIVVKDSDGVSLEKNITIVVDLNKNVMAPDILDALESRYAVDSGKASFVIDENLDDKIVYSLEDNDIFELIDGVVQAKDASTLVLGDYNLTVSVEDMTGTVLVKQIMVSVVPDKNTIAPIIVTDTFIIEENSVNPLVLELLVLGNGKIDTFSFVDGTDDNRFSISEDGVLSLKQPIDYEDSSIAHALEVKVRVSDDLNNISEVKTITINVENVEEGYRFVSQNYFTVLVGDTDIGTVIADKLDIRMDLPNYTFVVNNNTIAIDWNTGSMLFDSANLPVVDSSFTVNIVAENSYNGSRTISSDIIIDIVPDYQSMKPLIESYEAVVSTIPSTEVIVHVNAHSQAPDGNVTFSLSGEDASHFTVATNGDVSFNQAEDFYLPQDLDNNNIFRFIVDVTEDYGNITSTQLIEIHLLEDPAKMKPVITASAVSIIENSLGNALISIETPGSGSVTEYRVVPDNTIFTFNDGFLRFTSTSPDFESKSSYSVTLEIKDENGNISNTKTVTVNIIDMDEQYTFTSKTFFAPVEGTTTIGNVTVAAKSELSDAVVSYSIDSDPSNKFTIDASTGMLAFKVPTQTSDIGVENIVKVAVLSQYNGSTSVSSEIVVNVAALDRIITFIEQPVALVPENADIVNVTISASNNLDETINYAMQEGTDTNIFSINWVTGVMSINVPKYIWSSDPQANVYRGAVVAQDPLGNSKVQQGEMHVTTTVDGKPYFTSNQSVSVSENSTYVMNVHAVSNIFPTPILTYRIVGGINGTAFDLDSTTGELRFTEPANYEYKVDYEVVVEVNDNFGHSESTELQTIIVNILNIPDAPSSIVFESTDTNSVTVDDGTHVFIVPVNKIRYARVIATPSISNGTLSFTIIENPDSDIFSINSVSGEITIDTPPFSSDQLFTLVVRVSETNGESVNKTMYITIRD